MLHHWLVGIRDAQHQSSSLMCGHNAVAKNFMWDKLKPAIGGRDEPSDTVSLVFKGYGSRGRKYIRTVELSVYCCKQP